MLQLFNKLRDNETKERKDILMKRFPLFALLTLSLSSCFMMGGNDTGSYTPSIPVGTSTESKPFSYPENSSVNEEAFSAYFTAIDGSPASSITITEDMRIGEIMEDSGYVKFGGRLYIGTYIKDKRGNIYPCQEFYHLDGIGIRGKGDTIFFEQSNIVITPDMTYSEICGSIGLYQNELNLEFVLAPDLIAPLTVINGSDALKNKICATFPRKVLNTLIGEEFVPDVESYGNYFEITHFSLDENTGETILGLNIKTSSEIDWEGLGYQDMAPNYTSDLGLKSYHKTFYSGSGHRQIVYYEPYEEYTHLQIETKAEDRFDTWPEEEIAAIFDNEEIEIPGIEGELVRYEWKDEDTIRVYHSSYEDYCAAVEAKGYVTTNSDNYSNMYRIYTQEYTYSVYVAKLNYYFEIGFSRRESPHTYFFFEDASLENPDEQYHIMNIGYDKANYKGVYWEIEWTINPGDRFAITYDIGEEETRYGVFRTDFHDPLDWHDFNESYDSDLIEYIGTSSLRVKMIIESYLKACHLYAI